MFKINTRPFAISPGDAELRAGSQQLGAFEPQPRPFAQPKPVARGNDFDSSKLIDQRALPVLQGTALAPPTLHDAPACTS